jgi:hypothetical protein
MALLVLPMVTSATMITNALTAAPAYMSRMAFWTEGGRSGVWGTGCAPPVGYGWYMTAPGGIPVGVPNGEPRVTWPAAP